jgi:hypothetical protein
MPRAIEWSRVIVVVDPRKVRTRPSTAEVVFGIVARQGADEIGPFVIRILEGIGVRPPISSA